CASLRASPHSRRGHPMLSPNIVRLPAPQNRKPEQPDRPAKFPAPPLPPPCAPLYPTPSPVVVCFPSDRAEQCPHPRCRYSAAPAPLTRESPNVDPAAPPEASTPASASSKNHRDERVAPSRPVHPCVRRA